MTPPASPDDAARNADDLEWIDWHALERAIPLDELPSMHRAFLQLHRPGEEDWENVFLRKVQGKVQATLKELVRQGEARRDRRGSIEIARRALPGGWLHHLERARAEAKAEAEAEGAESDDADAGR